MKKKLNLKFLALAIATISASSCSLLNDKQVALPITSNPVGADLYIDGQYYGKTPKIVNLEPSKTYSATAVKEGYGTANIDLETWYSVRGNRGGGDNFRCVLDAVGTMLLIPAIGFYSVHCRDFKLKDYSINIANTGFQSPRSAPPQSNNRGGSNGSYQGYGSSNYPGNNNYPDNNNYGGYGNSQYGGSNYQNDQYNNGGYSAPNNSQYRRR